MNTSFRQIIRRTLALSAPKWPLLLSATLLTIALLAISWFVIVGDRALTGIDLQLIFHPYRTYIGDSFAELRIPLWNPYNAMGVPFAANPLARVFYPIDWLFLPLTPERAIPVSVLFHILLGGLGMWQLAGRSLSFSHPAKPVAVITFALSGVMMARVAQPNFLVATAWIPWVFLAGERLAQSHRSSWLLGLALGLTLQFLGGHPQYTWMTLIALLPWIIFCSLRAPEARYAQETRPSRMKAVVSNARRIAMGSVAWLIAGLITAGLTFVQLAPSIKLWSLSARRFADHPDFISSHALTNEWAPAGLFPLFQTIPATAEIVGYVGFVAAALSLTALILATRQRLMWFFAFLTAIAILLAYGENAPWFAPYAELIPGSNSFRASARWLAISTFGLACLAGIGAQCMAQPLAQKRRAGAAAILTTTCAVIGISVWSINDLMAGLTDETRPAWAFAGLAAVALVLAAIIFRRFPRILLPCAITAELAVAALPYDLHQAIPAEAYRTPSALAQAIRLDGLDGRLLSVADVYAGDLFLNPQRTQQQVDVSSAILNSQAVSRFSDALTNSDAALPNLNMVDALPSADLYDGGIGITRQFLEFQSTIIPGAANHIDYTLRTKLGAVPNPKILDYMNVRYLIEDTIHDGIVENHYVDMDLDLTLRPYSSPVRINLSGPFRTSAVVGFSFIARGAGLADGVETGRIALLGKGGSRIELPLITGTHTAEGDYDQVMGGPKPAHKLPAYTRRWRGNIRGYDSAYYFDLEHPIDVIGIELTSTLEGEAELHLRGLSLLEPSGASLPIPMRAGGQLQLVTNDAVQLTHLEGLKIYRNEPLLPRIRVVRQALIASDSASALSMLSSSGFDASSQVILQRGGPTGVGLRAAIRDFMQLVGVLGPRHGYGALGDDDLASLDQLGSQDVPGQLRLGTGGAGTRNLHVVRDEPEHIAVQVSLDESGILVLADSIYPDWHVTIDGVSGTIMRANHNFRAVVVPQGQHLVEFNYDPADFRLGWIVTSGTGILVASALVWPRLKTQLQRRQSLP